MPLGVAVGIRVLGSNEDIQHWVLLEADSHRRGGVTESAVQDHLGKALNRALQLGLHHPVGLTDPEYLHLLVRAGYLPLPAQRPYRRRLR